MFKCNNLWKLYDSPTVTLQMKKVRSERLSNLPQVSRLVNDEARLSQEKGVFKDTFELRDTSKHKLASSRGGKMSS